MKIPEKVSKLLYSENIQDKHSRNVATELQELPKPLTKIITFYGLVSAGLVLLTIYTSISYFYLPMFLVGLFAIICASCYTLYLYKKFHKGNFLKIQGQCIDTYKTGWRKQYDEILILNPETGKTYAFDVNHNKRFRFLPGDQICIYCPIDTFFHEDEGVILIGGYYGYERV